MEAQEVKSGRERRALPPAGDKKEEEKVRY